MPEKLPEYVWLYNNGRGHRWWSDVSNPENKDEAVKALIITPLLEHAGEAITILHLINAQIICGTLSLKYASCFDPNQIITDKLEVRLKKLLAEIEREEEEWK